MPTATAVAFKYFYQNRYTRQIIGLRAPMDENEDYAQTAERAGCGMHLSGYETSASFRSHLQRFSRRHWKEIAPVDLRKDHADHCVACRN